MKQAVMKKWVKALRSGKYKKTTEALTRHGRYCCLGVLCELAIKEGIPVEKRKVQFRTGSHSYDEKEGTLPKRVKKWAGIKRGNPYLRNMACTLTEANDELRYPFEKIADIIEAQWRGM